MYYIVRVRGGAPGSGGGAAMMMMMPGRAGVKAAPRVVNMVVVAWALLLLQPFCGQGAQKL